MPEEQKVTRKLSAILSSDVKGYSLLMAEDEIHTIQTLKAYRRIIADLISEYYGRVVDSPGDNILAEFRSAVDAVECAAKIQGKLAKENSKFVEEKKVQFRIGVNVGDVIQDGDRIYGNGVNVAARIEGLAEPGGICISRNAYDHISDKLNYGYEYLGEHTVKNIKKPVRMYKLLMSPEDAGKLIDDVPKPGIKNWIWATVVVAAVVITAIVFLVYQKMNEPEFESASVENMAYPLPDKASIAVLPFNDFSKKPEQEYLADGITENIITALSNTSKLFVIARNSVFAYKGKAVSIKKVSEELGVRYILEGSVQRAENRIRITAQLIDAIQGVHIWAQKYDEDIGDIFRLQDEIALKILEALRVELTEGEQALVMGGDTNNLDAYLHFLKGLEQSSKFTKEGAALARKSAQAAIEIDPMYPSGYRLLAATHLMDVWLGASQDQKMSIQTAYRLLEKVHSLDENSPGYYYLMGQLLLTTKQHDKAIESGERAVSLSPNNAAFIVGLAMIRIYNGEPEKALALFKKAMRLNPYPSSANLSGLGFTYNALGKYEEAVQAYRKAIQMSPDEIGSLVGIAVAYNKLGLREEAKSTVSEVLSMSPNFAVEGLKKTPFRNQKDLDLFITYIEQAGFPEYPPDKKPSEKRSIAVLPFDNLSDDPEQEYFSDGMTDDIITDLSKIKDLLVISRNSTFTYKGQGKKIPEIAKELNVRYVLEGSVRKAGDQIRINAQLIDAQTDHHIWAERFDGMLEDVFSLQDKISAKIVSALEVKLSGPEQKVLAAKGTFNIPAHDAYLKGIAHMRKFTPEDYDQAIRYFKQAIELDQNYSEAYASLSYIYWSTFYGGTRFWGKIGVDFPTSRIYARHYLELSMKKPTPRGYMMMGIMELYKRNFIEAIEFGQKAASISPNNADILYDLGTSLILVERLEEGIQNIKKSIMLDPLHKSTQLIGAAYFAMGDYEKTVKYIDIGIADNPERIPMLAYSAASHAFIGNDNEAKKAFEKWLTCFAGGYPTVQILYYLYVRKNIEVFDRLIEGLIKSGLKADPSDYYKVDIGNKMNGHEIRELSFGKTMIGNAFGFTWSVFRSKDGKTERPNIFGGIDKGISWIEGDSICSKMELRFNGFKSCSDVYRNPEGDEKTNSVYLSVNDYGIYPFSVKE